MNFRKRATPQLLGFQIAPLVDILLVLLVFFIVTWNFALSENELDVSVPAAVSGQEQQAYINQVVINIRQDGTVVLNRKEMTLEELGERLRSLAELYPDQAVDMRGDQNVPFGRIVEVIDVCQSAKIWNMKIRTTSPGAAR